MMAQLTGQMKPSLDDRGSHDPLDLIHRLDCGSLYRMHLLALACCSPDFAFDLAEIAFGTTMSKVCSAALHEYFLCPARSVPGRSLRWSHRRSFVDRTTGRPVPRPARALRRASAAVPRVVRRHVRPDLVVLSSPLGDWDGGTAFLFWRITVTIWLAVLVSV
jgi:hypothetical protein